MIPSNSSASSSPISADAGIIGGYEGNSLALKIIIAFCLGLSIYNVLELQILLFGTFQRFKGLYFWSLVISGLGIIPYSLGFLFKYFSIFKGGWKWFPMSLQGVGWYPMVTGQSVVLWSRLHLIVTGESGDKILRYTKLMIIVNVFMLHIPTTVLSFGANGTIETMAFVRGYNVMEKIQMCGFFLQEVILSSIYMVETIRIIRGSVQQRTMILMYQLMGINVLIIIMDLALLALECASLYILETVTKPVFYSMKLKLEFAILGKLVHFVGGSRDSCRDVSVALSDVEKLDRSSEGNGRLQPWARGDGRDGQTHGNDLDLANPTNTKTDLGGAWQPPKNSSSGKLDRYEIDVDEELARIEHLETLHSHDR